MGHENSAEELVITARAVVRAEQRLAQRKVDRDNAIRDARQAGLTVPEIMAKTDLSRSQVNNILGNRRAQAGE